MKQGPLGNGLKLQANPISGAGKHQYALKKN